MNKQFITIDFLKMSGAGNDFILIDNRNGLHLLDWGNVAPMLCDRHNGIGADGLLIIDKHPAAHFAMNYYNSDGSYGGMCGNGGRCAAAFFMGQEKSNTVDFYALDYLYSASMTSQGDIRLRMKEPSNVKLDINIEFHDKTIVVHFVNTGAPHAIIFLEDLPQEIQKYIQTNGIYEIARFIRFSSNFAPVGTNVNFIGVIDNRSLTMRTYERGVEDETLACGTGSIAAAVISCLTKGLSSPIIVTTRSNERLIVSFDREDGKFSNVSLEGSAKIVFRGQYILRNEV